MIRTNNVPRYTIDAYELTATERKEFDYLDWEAIDKGEDSATFFRYKGELYDLGEFMRDACPEGWDGGMADSMWTGIIVKLVQTDGGEAVIVGRWIAD